MKENTSIEEGADLLSFHDLVLEAEEDVEAVNTADAKNVKELDAVEALEEKREI